MNSTIYVAGWTLVHFAWQGAAVAAAAALALRLLRDASPQSRYAAGCLALAAMLALPMMTAVRLAAAQGDVEPAPPPVHRTVFLRVTPDVPAQHDRVLIGIRHRAPATPPGEPATPAGPLVMSSLVSVWLIGVSLLLARLAGGWCRVQRLHQATRALPPSHWQAASLRLARQLGVQRLVRVVDAALVDGPVVIGWLQPVIVLPVAALAGLTPQQVQAILAHELAHVRRHDALVNFAQTFAETLLFYHPAVWWVSARIRIEREHCCDDVALTVSGDAYAYASALAELETWRVAQPALSLGATGGSLMQRVARLLAPPVPSSARGGVIVTLAFALLFVVGAGALQLLVARQPAAAPPSAESSGAAAWRMVFDHPSGEMAIRGFTGRDLVRYAYQVPTSRVVNGPAWLDTDSFDLATTVDHVPAADETPGIVRQLLEERFALRVHETTIDVPALALEIARPDGALGPNLQPATAECFDQQAWVAAGAPNLGPLPQGQRTVMCGVWDEGLTYDRARSVTMDDLAAAMSSRFMASNGRPVINRTTLAGPFDVSLQYFKPATLAMLFKPSLRSPLRLAGFESVDDVLESQLGLKLVPTTTAVPAIAIDEIQRPLRELARFESAPALSRVAR